MGGRTSQTGQRVDIVRINDDPHDDYRAYDPWTMEMIGRVDSDGKPISGIPLLKSTERGKVLDKEVECNTVHCDECGTVVHFDEDESPVCQQCGAICVGREAREVQRERLLQIDAKAAGRIDKKKAERGR